LTYISTPIALAPCRVINSCPCQCAYVGFRVVVVVEAVLGATISTLLSLYCVVTRLGNISATDIRIDFSKAACNIVHEQHNTAMSGKYVFKQGLKELRFHLCQTSEHSAAARYASFRSSPLRAAFQHTLMPFSPHRPSSSSHRT